MIDRLMLTDAARATPVARRPWTASVVMVAGTLAIAVSGYAVSLRVGGERAAADRLTADNHAIVAELRAMDAELRVRMRLPQLQRWNDEVLGLQPVSARQFLVDPLQLATYGTNGDAVDPDGASARVRLAVATDVREVAAPMMIKASLATLPQPVAPQAFVSRTVTPVAIALKPSPTPAPMARAPRPAAAPVARVAPAPVRIAAAAPRTPAVRTPAARAPAARATPSGGLDPELIAMVEQAVAAERAPAAAGPVDLLRVAAHPRQ